MSDKCTCGRICVGRHVTEHRTLDYGCPEHGVDSAWYNSPEQVQKREADRLWYRELRARAAAARAKAGEESRVE